MAFVGKVLKVSSKKNIERVLTVVGWLIIGFAVYALFVLIFRQMGD